MAKNKVRRLRQQRLLTQTQLARASNVSSRTIVNIEQGKDCRMDTKRKLLIALGVPFEERDKVFQIEHSPRRRRKSAKHK